MILASGGTRCNITQATDNRGIVAAYGPPGKFLHSALAAFSVQRTIEFFKAEGVATKVEETGKIFPVSNKATDVLDALVRRLARSGAVLTLNEAMTSITRHEPEALATDIQGEPSLTLPARQTHFAIATAARSLNASKVILTTGGQSYPGSGTTGDGYRFAAALGHRIVPPRPALVPLTTHVPWVAELRGITMPDVAVRIVDQENTLATRRGSLLFAHFGLSGPVILDVSRAVSGHPSPSSLVLMIDSLPGESEAALSEWLRDESLAQGKKQLAVVLANQLPRRLCEPILTQANLAIDRKAAALTKDERQRLVHAIKYLAIPITGTLGFKKAEVTAGGVALDEVDSRTMQSKLAPGLFLAGEVLDLDGPIGGYNFQAAWSTGLACGGCRCDFSCLCRLQGPCSPLMRAARSRFGTGLATPSTATSASTSSPSANASCRARRPLRIAPQPQQFRHHPRMASELREDAPRRHRASFQERHHALRHRHSHVIRNHAHAAERNAGPRAAHGEERGLHIDRHRAVRLAEPQFFLGQRDHAVRRQQSSHMQRRLPAARERQRRPCRLPRPAMLIDDLVHQHDIADMQCIR